MPDWNDILNEITDKAKVGPHDLVRREYLQRLHDVTKRNIIIYYSGWLQKPGMSGTEVNDADKNGFMNAIHGLDRNKGLDLVLHTPGGGTAATESLVDYLHSMFGRDIRAIVPQLALSAGTMIACATKEIIMGKHSSLGPIDPQFGGLPAHGVIEEFNRAFDECKKDQLKIAVWQPIIAKYNPTLIGECEKAIAWSEQMVNSWLSKGMLRGKKNKSARIDRILKGLGDHALTLSHARHLSLDKCDEIGLEVKSLEDNPALQDAVLSVHHACIHTLAGTNAIKIIENHLGKAFIQIAQQVVVRQ
ncbi:MAG: S49 family peptidase [Chloroflexi bacterium]|nr:S49 family peptidase [Chloroflexota bacterium]